MAQAPIVIPPRRSLAFFVALAIVMVVVSYLFVVLLAIACVYLPGLLLMQALNFQFLALFVAGLIVAASLLWSLVPRRNKFVVSGLLLARSAHPRLFAQIDEIAAILSEPVPPEVYLIADANAWVADRGGIMGVGTRRVMGVGFPLLAALNVSEFRAIVAHEFAHYYGGDTKLGPWLHRAQVAMIRAFQNMGSVGGAMRVALMQVLYIVVFGILKAYWKIFLRAINFVSRRQEFRADELACIIAGPQSLVGGLRTVHGTAGAWPEFVSNELLPMLDSGSLPPITEGFSQFLAAPPIAKRVRDNIEKELRDGKAEPYDSHPPLRERIAAAETLAIFAPQSNGSPASSLLENLSDEEVRFLEAVNPGLMEKSLKRVSWNQSGTAVVIPFWRSFVSGYGHLLQGITIGNLPESLGRLPEIASQIRDPEGMLLSSEQRIVCARSLMSASLGLALVDHGWFLRTQPGTSYLEYQDVKLEPYELIEQLSDGKYPWADWSKRSFELNIGEIPLMPEHSTNGG